ncbi:hypothetical protein [Xenorhabdus bharatensis]|uniref:hypothetical protein n=1 Tax=Xenorhabdus bharatensis TaxID=3136256 RepID=UPI0030F47171
MRTGSTNPLSGISIIDQKIAIEKCDNITEVGRYINEFQKHLIQNDWFKYITDASQMMNSKKTELSSDQRLTLKFFLTKSLLSTLIRTLSSSRAENDIYFLGYLNTLDTRRIIIGIMKITLNTSRKPNYPVIDTLIIHPGLENCGYLFIEEAVNFSQSKEYKGNLKLVTAAESLLDVYAKIGFIEQSLGEMVLEPLVSQQWKYDSSLQKFNFISKCL